MRNPVGRQGIQEFLTTAVQNIMVLVRNFKEHDKPALELRQPRAKKPILRALSLDVSRMILSKGTFLHSMTCFQAIY
jgi:hypothetical protein